MFAFTFYDLLGNAARRSPHHVAVIDGDRRATYAELEQRAASVAGYLSEQGVRRGDRVCIQMRKSLEEVIGMFACARLGAVWVNVSSTWTGKQLRYVLNDCGARVLFAEPRGFASLAEKPLPAQLDQVIIRDGPVAGPAATCWSELPCNSKALDPVGVDRDLSAIVYTSGSTGKPKGVMLSNLNLLQGARSVAAYLNNSAADRVLAVLPFCFDYGLSQLTTIFLTGGTLVLHNVMMPAEVVAALEKYEITGMAAVPPLWTQLVEYWETVDKRLPPLRYITNSGGKIPERTLNLLPDAFPGTDIYLMYGLTEAFRSTYLPPELYAKKRGSMGRPIPNVETFIVDPELGICGPGQQGELVHRGSLICQGYWNQPEATSAKIKPCPQLKHLIGDEPVLFSGDIVRIDEDGDYWFVGRNDALIKCSGVRVSPDEIEDLVYESGLVTRVVAIAVPDERLGHVVELAVTTDNLSDETALLQYCRANMPSYMLPRRVHLWAGAFPLTGSGKLDRVAITSRCLRAGVREEQTPSALKNAA